MKPITPQQFAALIALTSVQPGSKTHQALERHLVIGFSKSDAAMMSGIKPQVLNSALRNVRAAAARARVLHVCADGMTRAKGDLVKEAGVSPGVVNALIASSRKA